MSGEEKEGGKWYHEKHDYLSIPLYVREGSIIALGAKDDNAVYDYADGVTFRVYALDEGKTAQTCVYDTENNRVADVTVKHENGVYEVEVNGGTNVKVELVHIGNPADVEGAAYSMDGDTVVLTMPQSGKVLVK